MYKWTAEDLSADFDQELADSYIGKYILVGVTVLDAFGKELEKLQMHGVVQAVASTGIHIALEGQRCGQVWVMPPTLESVFPAEPGTYTLHSTGEVIDNPDLLTTWRVTRPCQH